MAGWRYSMGDLGMHDYLSCLNCLTDLLASRLADANTQEILDCVAEPLNRALGAQDSALALIGEPGDDLTITRSRTPISSPGKPHLHIDWLPTDDQIRLAIAAGGPSWIGPEDSSRLPARSVDPVVNAPGRSVLLLPLGVREEPVGVLALCFPVRQETRRQEVAALAQTIASQLGVLLAQATEAKRRQVSQGLYQAIFDGISDGALLLDSGGRCHPANDAALALFQYSREELLAAGIGGLIVDIDGDTVKLCEAALENGERFTAELDMRRKDGTVILAEVSGYPMHHRGQLWCLTLYRDVRARRSSEAQLRHRLAQLESLYAMSLVITADLTTDDILDKIVDHATTLVGAEFGGVFINDEEQGALVMKVAQRLPEQYLGMWLSPGEGVAGTVFLTGEPINVHYGSEHFGRVSGMPGLGITAALVLPMRWGERRIGVLAVAHTREGHRFTKQEEYLVGLAANHAAIALTQAELFQELQRTAAELRQANLELQELDRMKDNLLAMVTHELRRPLSSARLSIELVQGSPAGLSGQERALLQSALNSIDKQTALVDDLLQAAHMGRLPASDKVPHDLRDLVVEAVADMEAAAREASVRLSSQMPDAPVLCLVDPSGLGRALANLLSNAVKFTPEGGASLCKSGE